MQIDGLSAIVTGGASGLGKAAAQLLAHRGAKVTIFDLDETAGKAVADQFGGLCIGVDVSDSESVDQALNKAEDTHGTARILINCAGIAPGAKTVGKQYTPHPLDTFVKAVTVNLVGTFNTISQFSARAAAAEEINGERGVIINTASIAAFDGQMGQAAYSASKSGVVGMTLPIARDLAEHKIRVMTIAPGIFLTPMLANFPQHVQETLGAQVPHPSRVGEPSEFAQLAEAIISNPMLNGEVIRLDGAIRMAPR